MAKVWLLAGPASRGAIRSEARCTALSGLAVISYCGHGAPKPPARQLAELLTARVLLSDGWPLAKIAVFTRATPLEGLLDLLPKDQHGTRAPEPAALCAESARRRGPEASLITSAAALARYSDPALYLRIDITPWCHVYVERAAAGSVSPEEADELGRAFRHALVVQRIPRGEKK